MLDKKTNRIMMYESLEKQTSFAIRGEHISLKQSNEIQYEVRHDLVDCEICICTAEALNHVADDFYCVDLKGDFIKNIEANEIIDHVVLGFEVQGPDYWGRVVDPRTYGEISKDIITRRAHPLVIDQMSEGMQCHSLNKYIDQGAVIDIQGEVGNDCVVAKGTKIGRNSKIKNSIIGIKCKIGANVEIKDAIIWNGVEINDNCRVTGALIADNAVLHEGVTIEMGVMISIGVVVKPGSTVKARSIVSRYTYSPAEQKFVQIQEDQVEPSFENALLSYLPRDSTLVENETLGYELTYSEEESDVESVSSEEDGQ